MGKQGAQNSNLGSVSGLMESMVQYFDGKFSEIKDKLDLQDRQVGVMGTELQQIRKSIGRLEQSEHKLALPEGKDLEYACNYIRDELQDWCSAAKVFYLISLIAYLFARREQ